MKTGFFSCLVALLFLADAQAQNKGPNAARQFQIRLVMKRGDPQGSVENGAVKVLAEPLIVTPEGRPATFVSGSQLFTGGDMVQDGLMATLVIERAEDGKIRLKVVLERREVAEAQEDQSIIKTVQARFSRLVHPGEVSCFSWPIDGERTWAEISVREVRILGELTPRPTS